MLRFMKERIGSLVLGASLLAAACADDDPESTDSPWSPIVAADTGVPGVDAGSALPGTGGTGTPGVVQEAGAAPSFDASQPGRGASADTGAQPQAEAGARDPASGGSDSGLPGTG